ncbi:MAG: hypothetical protein GY711_01810 [bacterium]|nr:hypothetical protein [bacterium]
MLDALFDFDKYTITTIYTVCAVIGGAVLSLQMLLLMFGGDVDADTDVDSIDASDGFGLISIRSIASFLVFFGLSGLWGTEEDWGGGKTLAVAFGSGTAMLVIVAWLMAMQSKLSSEGNVQPENAIGNTATVYLGIPSENSGKGKITVAIQGRTHEYAAFTRGPKLPTGTTVRVVSLSAGNTFEVEGIES